MDGTTDTAVGRRHTHLSAAQAHALLALGGREESGAPAGGGGGRAEAASLAGATAGNVPDAVVNTGISRTTSAVTLAVLGVIGFSVVLPVDSGQLVSNGAQSGGSVTSPLPGIDHRPLGGGAGSPSSLQQESQTMFAKLRNAAVATTIGAAAITGGASAQAVQWNVSDGGNGHWYQAFEHPERLSWITSDQLARAMNGHLVTLTSAAESAFLSKELCGLPNLNVPGYRGPWFGLHFVAGAWAWITGEPLQYSAWAPGQPDSLGSQNYAGWGPCEQMWGNEYGDDPYNPVWLVVEWDADCNNDGIVDYGQIRSGQLVDLDGNNIPDCCASGASCTLTRHVPADYPTIQAAIDSAMPGDRVLVAPGTYHEQINLRGKDIRLIGVGGASQTVIDGDANRTVILGSGEPAGCEVAGFTIRNGAGGVGGMDVSNSAVRVHDCTFVGNRGADLWGGAAFRSVGGATVVEDCRFRGNVGVDQSTASAWYHLGGGSFILRRCDFVDNLGNDGGNYGQTGGVVVKVNPEFTGVDGLIEDCRFAGQRTGDPTPSSWGAIMVHASTGAPIVIRGCTFAAATGGQDWAVMSGQQSRVDMSDCRGCGFGVVLGTSGGGNGTTTNCVFASICSDCNLNGSTDLDEILTGEANDSNYDGIPDACQCGADLNRDGNVDGADLASILAFWGPTGVVFPAADLNHDGRVDGFDLSLVLAAWGPCGQ